MSPTQAIVILLVLTRVATVNTKKLTCSITRTFIATEDHVLSGHTLSTHQVYSLPECHTLCLDHPRCLSYNFQATSISSRNFCEINDATGKMCPQDLARSTGYKYYEDKDATCGRQCPPRDADGTNFQLHFPNKSVTDYVRFDLLRCAPPLTAFTVCLWLKTAETADDGASFSYSLPGQDNEILLTDYTSLRFLIANTYSEMGLAVNDDYWYHICTTWENTAGSWNFYVDGELWENGVGLETGHVIDNNGIFILGQDQDSYGSGFERSQSFFGQMYGVNMWNRVLTKEEISHMSTNCSYGVGNYLRWSDFVTGLHGGVTVTSPATCLP